MGKPYSQITPQNCPLFQHLTVYESQISGGTNFSVVVTKRVKNVVIIALAVNNPKHKINVVRGGNCASNSSIKFSSRVTFSGLNLTCAILRSLADEFGVATAEPINCKSDWSSPTRKKSYGFCDFFRQTQVTFF